MNRLPFTTSRMLLIMIVYGVRFKELYSSSYHYRRVSACLCGLLPYACLTSDSWPVGAVILTLHSNPISVITKTILLSWSLWLGFGHGCRNIEIVLVTDWFELVWESGILQTSVREGLSHRKIELKWILDQPLAFQASDRPSMHFWWQTNVIKGEWPYPSKSELYCQYSLLLDSLLLISYLSSL